MAEPAEIRRNSAFATIAVPATRVWVVKGDATRVPRYDKASVAALFPIWVIRMDDESVTVPLRVLLASRTSCDVLPTWSEPPDAPDVPTRQPMIVSPATPKV